MNPHKTIKQLEAQYANNPATAQCYRDIMQAWLATMKQFSEQIQKQKQK